jgi:hypothetical protein
MPRSIDFDERMSKLRYKLKELEKSDDSGDFKEACRQFMDAILHMDLDVSGPGPYSPTRWILFNIHNHLYPDNKECEELYHIASPSNEYIKSVNRLIDFFNRRDNE